MFVDINFSGPADIAGPKALGNIRSDLQPHLPRPQTVPLSDDRDFASNLSATMPISRQGIKLDLGLQSPTQLHYTSLAQLDLSLPGDRHEEVQRYVASHYDKDSLRPRLLVCHDYKARYP